MSLSIAGALSMLARLLLSFLMLLPLPLLAATLNLCAEPWPPYIYPEKDGRPQGLAAEAMKAAAQKHGYRVRYMFLSADACYKLMREQKIDIMAFALGKDSPPNWIQTREPLVYWVLRAWVAQASPMQEFKDLAQFSGARVAHVAVYDYPAAIQGKQDWQRVRSADSDMSVRLLATGKVDVIFEDQLTIENALPAHQQAIKGLSPVVAGIAQPFSMRADLETLRADLDAIAVQWHKDGKLDQFYRRYFKSSFSAVREHEARP